MKYINGFTLTIYIFASVFMYSCNWKEFKDIDELCNKLKSNDGSDRIEAAEELALYGPAASNALPTLYDIIRVDNPDVALAAIEAISVISPNSHETQSTLADALFRESEIILEGVISAFVYIEPDKEVFFPRILEGSKSNTPEVRRNVIIAIGIFWEKQEEVKSEIEEVYIDGLHDSEAIVRMAAIVTANLMNPSEVLSPEIVNMLNDPSEDVRVLVLEVASGFQIDISKYLNSLMEAMEDSSEVVRIKAAKVLLNYSRRSENIIEILGMKIDKLEDIYDEYEGEIRKYILTVMDLVVDLERMGDVLFEGLKDENEMVRLTAISIIRKYGEKAIWYIPVITEIAETDESEDVRILAEAAVIEIKGENIILR